MRMADQPDISVYVGTGAEKTQFQVHLSLLSIASPVFKGMIAYSNDSSCPLFWHTPGTICLPSDKPSEFRLFYEFVKPGYMQEGQSPVISIANVRVLLPWFDKYQMDHLRGQCVECINSYMQELSNDGRLPTLNSVLAAFWDFDADDDSA